MTRSHGPYKHGRKWRIVRRHDDHRQHYQVFDTKQEAFDAIASEHRMTDEDALALLSKPSVLPRDQLWIYILVSDDGAAIYVGSTRNPDGRRHDHRENDVPFARMEIYPEVFDREIGLQVEAALIRKLNPPMNQRSKLEITGKLSVRSESPRSKSSSEISE